MFGAVITSLFMSIKNIIEKIKRHDFSLFRSCSKTDDKKINSTV
jgi:hypothetical protein